MGSRREGALAVCEGVGDSSWSYARLPCAGGAVTRTWAQRVMSGRWGVSRTRLQMSPSLVRAVLFVVCVCACMLYACMCTRRGMHRMPRACACSDCARSFTKPPQFPVFTVRQFTDELMKRQPSLCLCCWSDNPRYTRELVSRNKQLPLTMICGFSDHIDSYEDHRSWYPYEGVRKDTRSKDIS